MWKSILPLLDAFPEAKWLTVGDGRYGSDARFIKDRGLDVVASDISSCLLEEGKKKGLIDKYSRENAERLSFADDEFDFCLCKEAYHHFPRPMVALHEMLRVSTRGIVLIEPNDQFIFSGFRALFFRKLKDTLRRPLGRQLPEHRFEETGNYVYGISKREMEKVAAGMSYNTVAFKGLNDYYQNGLEYEPARNDNPIYNQVRFKTRLKDLLCTLGVNRPNLLVAIILKDEPSPVLSAGLKRDRFDIVIIPQNPHI